VVTEMEEELVFGITDEELEDAEIEEAEEGEE